MVQTLGSSGDGNSKIQRPTLRVASILRKYANGMGYALATCAGVDTAWSGVGAATHTSTAFQRVAGLKAARGSHSPWLLFLFVPEGRRDGVGLKWRSALVCASTLPLASNVPIFCGWSGWYFL